MTPGETEAERSRYWINREQLEEALTITRFFAESPDREHLNDMERLSVLLDDLEVEEAYLSFTAEWVKVSPGDPEMDDTERVMFPDETYRCSRCGGKGYFGASCPRDRYCQKCGARMNNSGRRT